MKGINIILIIFLSSLAHVVTAQNDSSLKIYGNFLYAASSQTPTHFDHDDNAPFLYNHLSFAFRKEKPTHSDEFELKLLFKSEARDNHRVTQFETSFSYERGYELKKKLFNVFTVRLGGAAKLFYLREDIDSREFNPRPVLNNVGGIWVGPFAHLEFDITDRIYFDLNTSPFSANFTINETREEILAPNGEWRQFTSTDFDSYLFQEGYMGGEDEEDELQQEWDEKRKKKGKGKKKKRKKKRRG